MNSKFILLCALCIATVQNGDSTFVDPNVVLQSNFRGWGTSLAWWAEMVGGMDQDVFDYIVDALFSPSKLNLNIVRYVIGGTTPDNYTCGDYRTGSATESYRDGFDHPYDWTRDPRQRKTLQGAIDKGANILEAFSNSPPQWLTISGCSKGNALSPPLFNNFNPTNAPDFADYATEVIKHFHDEWNITFTSFAPFNEPFGLHGIGSWFGAQSSQEGCNMNRASMVSVIKSTHEAIVAKNLSFLTLAVSDETQVNTAIQSYDHFMDNGLGEMFSRINVHGYWDNYELSRKDLLSLKCSQRGHEVWMDEMGWGGTPPDNMEQGLSIATRIVVDLRMMLPSAWVYWQIVEGRGQWGVIDVPYFFNSTLDEVIINSGYHAMMQFSRHIKQGYQLVYISDENSVAAISVPEQKLVIVSVNPTTEEMTQEYDLSLFANLGTPSLSRTSPSEQHLDLPPPSVGVGNKITVQLPAESVSTLEFSGVQISEPVNLLKNGDFETVVEVIPVIPADWEVTGDTNGVSEEDPWRNAYSGALLTSPGHATLLEQTVQFSTPSTSPCELYLSAWCSSQFAGTKLGVSVNETVTEIEIVGNGAYNSYGLSFSASNSDVVRVFFSNYGTAQQGTAKIDNVFLHYKCME